MDECEIAKMPSQGKEVVSLMFRDCDLKLGCGPVLNIKKEDLEKKNMSCFETKCRQRKSFCARGGINFLLAPSICLFVHGLFVWKRCKPKWISVS